MFINHLKKKRKKRTYPYLKSKANKKNNLDDHLKVVIKFY